MSLLTSPMDSPTSFQHSDSLYFLTNSSIHFRSRDLVFTFLAGTFGVLGSLSGCLVWQIAYSETLWTPERGTQMGRASSELYHKLLCSSQVHRPRRADRQWPQREMTEHPKGMGWFATGIKCLWASPELFGKEFYRWLRILCHQWGARPVKLVLHVILMTTILVTRPGTPTESQITAIIQHFKRQLQSQNTVILGGQGQWLFNLYKPSLKVASE